MKVLSVTHTKKDRLKEGHMMFLVSDMVGGDGPVFIKKRRSLGLLTPLFPSLTVSFMYAADNVEQKTTENVTEKKYIHSRHRVKFVFGSVKDRDQSAEYIKKLSRSELMEKLDDGSLLEKLLITSSKAMKQGLMFKACFKPS